MQFRHLKNTLLATILCILIISCATVKPIQGIGNNLYQSNWIQTKDQASPHNIETVADILTDYDVIFFGELHEHPGVHLAQMHLFEALHNRNKNITLSLEQFERDTQNYVDDFLIGDIGEQYLISKTKAWKNYTTSYRPLVQFAQNNHLSVIAANAPKAAVICVGRKGLDYLDTLSTQDRNNVAKDIDISDGEYRKKFMAFMSKNSSHGSTHGKKSNVKLIELMKQRSYSAQVLRDETMAESIANHISKNPKQQVLHLNGQFHSSRYLGTVERLKRRMPQLKIAVIETVESDEKALTKEDLDKGDFILRVKPTAESFVNPENKKAWSKEILKKRIKSAVKCD